MDPGEVPPELQGLTYIEEMLIAQIHPVISIYRLKGGQFGHSGNVINFRQNIQQYITKLPLHPKDLPSTLLFYKATADGIAEFRVRAKKIRDALIWLKNNNIYYKQLELNEEVLQILPKDGDVSTMMNSLNVSEESQDTENESNHVQECNIPKFDVTDQQSVIDKTLELNYPEQVWIIPISLHNSYYQTNSWNNKIV